MLLTTSPQSTATTQATLKPYTVKPVGLLAAIAVLGVVIFLSPPKARVWIAGVVLVMALLQQGGRTAGFINLLTEKVYGGVK
jgi:hypothetical protein